jgi:hypothetical protein
MEQEIWLANGLLILHAIVVGITVAGAIALFTGRFSKFHKKDFFAVAFIICAFGQIFSLVLTGGCIFTEWERNIRLEADPTASYSKTFLKEYMPFLPEGIIHATPFLTIGALIGVLIQIRFAIKRKRNLDRAQSGPS